MMSIQKLSLVSLVFILSTLQSYEAHSQPRRLHNNSPWFSLNESDVSFVSSQSGWVEETGELEIELGISAKMFEMIESATDFILASVFLFDNMYPDRSPDITIAAEITDALIAKKKAFPNMPIGIILDPLHKSYGERNSPLVTKLLENGVHIFYSDRLATAAIDGLNIFEGASQFFRDLRRASSFMDASLGRIGRIRMPLPDPRKWPPQLVRLDGELPQVQSIFRGLLLKANHRKLLVVGANGESEALVSSANAHDGSLPSNNSAISVRGGLATYIYEVLRADIASSLKLGPYYFDLGDQNLSPDQILTDIFPTIDFETGAPSDTGIRAKFVTESEIKFQIVEMLRNVQPGDRVRIQMFYLSDIDIVHAILDAAARTENPIEILLDANEGAFNEIKQGDPNRQVAAYMLERLKVENLERRIHIRWADSKTREGVQEVRQNHAKTMSIVNELTAKYEIITGSSNWTRKNLGTYRRDINLESDVVVEGSKQTTESFNHVFDRMFQNQGPGVIYSHPYETYGSQTGARGKWAKVPVCARLLGQTDRSGRPLLQERRLVAW